MHLLWLVVLFRLLCPVSFDSVVSVLSLPFVDAPVAQLEAIAPPAATAGAPAAPLDGAAAVDVDASTVPPAETQAASAVASFHWLSPAAILWLAGALAVLLYSAATYLRLKRRIRAAVRMEGNVYVSDRIDAPFICGILRPRIYLPLGLNEKEKQLIWAHERAPLKPLDHLFKPLFYLACALHPALVQPAGLAGFPADVPRPGDLLRRARPPYAGS